MSEKTVLVTGACGEIGQALVQHLAQRGGFRIVTNTGAEGGQEVHHMHWHVMGGPRPWLRG